MEIFTRPDFIFEQVLAFWPDSFLLQGLIIIFFSLFIEDATTLFIATLIAMGKFSFEEGMLWLTLGISLGDGFLYYLGVLMRRGKMKTPRFLKDLKVPLTFVFGARFVPGTRFIAYAAAGILQTNIGIFTLLAVSSSLIWTYGVLKIVDAVNGTLALEEAKSEYFSVFLGVLILLVGLEIILGRLIKKKLASSRANGSE